MIQTGNQLNSWGVPKKQWNKWNDIEQRMFNYMLSTMMENPKSFLHPESAEVREGLWKTTAWNTAWIVADGLRDIRKNG